MGSILCNGWAQMTHHVPVAASAAGEALKAKPLVEANGTRIIRMHAQCDALMESSGRFQMMAQQVLAEPASLPRRKDSNAELGRLRIEECAAFQWREKQPAAHGADTLAIRCLEQ